MYKIVVTNFATLIDKDEAISTDIMLAIEKIRSQSKFVITTNKTYQEILDYNRSFPFIDYIIALNGAYLYDVNNQKCLYQKKINQQNIQKILSLFPKENLTFYSENSNILMIKITNPNIKNIPDFLLKNKITLEAYQINNDLYLTSKLTNKYKCLIKIISSESVTNEVFAINYDESDSSLIKNLSHQILLNKDESAIKILNSFTSLSQ